MRHAVKIVSVSALALSALSFATAVRSAEPHYVLPPQAVMADPRFIPPQSIIQCAATDDACACPQTAAVPSSAGPMIISYGPPPSAYSPSADFRARLQTSPGWASYVDSCIAASAAAASAYPPPPPPPQPYPMYAPGYGPSPAQMSAMELPPPPGFEGCQPRQFAVEERFACRDGYAAGYARQPERSRTVAWSAPLCNCPTGNATCSAGCNTDCKVACNGACNTTCSTACGHDCPCGAACQCGTACDCAANCTCSSNATKACAANCNTCTSQCSTDCACGNADRIDHILEAVHHLEAAGMQADADALRRKCDQEMKSVVERLKKAEAEVAALKSASLTSAANCTASCEACPSVEGIRCDETGATAAQQVLVNVEMVDVNVSKCRELGLDICSDLFPDLTKVGFACREPRFGVIHNADSLQASLEAAKKEGLVKIISRPTIVTLAGRPAQARIGKEVPVPNNSGSLEYQFVGTEFDVVPVVASNGLLHLDLRCNHSELDANQKFQVGGCWIPGLSKTGFDTAIEVASGGTAALTGMTHHDNSSDSSEFQLMVFVRPEIVEPAAAQVRATNWTTPFESCDSGACSSAFACKPTSCDEGPAFTTCSAFKKCECGSCEGCGACSYFELFNTKNAFPEPSAYDPFEPKVIEIPAFQFELPGTIPVEKQIEADYEAEATPREFIPHMAKPLWLTRPVVAPVNYEEPVRE
jgi:hypothetical protein